MPISFTCPHCGDKVTISRRYAGTRGKCPHCKDAVNVPSLETAPDEPGSDELEPLEPDSPDPSAPTLDVPMQIRVKEKEKEATKGKPITVTVAAPPADLAAEVARAGADPTKRFGHFILLSELGKGGMGAVHRAWDEKLKRVVALKIVLEAEDDSVVKRFQREAQAVARLKHASIVSVHEMGEEAGKHWLSMDLIEGKTLERRIHPKEGEPKLPLAKAVEVMRDVARAVHYAHEQGVIHRDLKPLNVMLDTQDRPYVLDFGLARLRESKTKLTRTGYAMGTPYYMSPEQAGDGVPIDERTDVWSLGAMLYEVLTGRPPFDGATPLHVMQAVVKKDPVPPRKNSRRVPEALETVCLKCLEKKPENRYPSAAALADDLDRYLAGKAIEARRSDVATTLTALFARHLVASAVGAALLLLITGGIGVSRLAASRAEASLGWIKEAVPDSRIDESLDALDGFVKDYPDRPGMEWIPRRREELQAQRVRAHAAALVDRGLMLEGLGPDKDSEAARCYREAADAGSARAMNKLAVMLRDGRGVPKDDPEAVRWLRLAVLGGEPSGMANLGEMIRDGRGAERDDAEAAHWFAMAAKAGDARGMADLADALERGTGVEKDAELAARWWRKAAEAGHGAAMVHLGLMLEHARGTAHEIAEAAIWYRKAAEVGNDWGMNNIGIMLRDGTGVAKDEAESARWFKKAALAGNTDAMVNLGYSCEQGLGVPKDAAEAVRWYRKGAQGGQVLGMRNVAWKLRQGIGVARDDAEALSWFRRAGDAGDATAMGIVGDMLRAGQGAEKDDVGAARWYRRAAEWGNSWGMVNFGYMLETGRGVRQDDAAACRWYRKAADAGEASGMANLGHMLLDGRGVEQNDGEAVTWLRQAAAAGDAWGMYCLGFALEWGRGTKMSAAEALEWYRKAAKLGNTNAIEALRRIEAADAAFEKDSVLRTKIVAESPAPFKVELDEKPGAVLFDWQVRPDMVERGALPKNAIRSEGGRLVLVNEASESLYVGKYKHDWSHYVVEFKIRVTTGTKAWFLGKIGAGEAGAGYTWDELPISRAACAAAKGEKRPYVFAGIDDEARATLQFRFVGKDWDVVVNGKDVYRLPPEASRLSGNALGGFGFKCEKGSIEVESVKAKVLDRVTPTHEDD